MNLGLPWGASNTGHTGAQPARPGLTAEPAEHTVADRQQRAVRTNSAQDCPLLPAAAAAALACGFATSDGGRWPLAWALVGLALAGAWIVAIVAPARCVMLSITLAHVAKPAGVLLLLWSIGLAWQPAAHPLSAELPLLRQSAVAAVACAGAVALAPSTLGSLVALLLPTLWLVSLPTARVSEGLPATLFFSALVAALSLASRRAWRRRLREQAMCARRLAEAESACHAAQRADEDKTRFLSATSHDLRQPVHALGLFAATLDKRLRGTREEPLVRNVVRSIEGLDRSLNAMLDISRLDAGAVEPNFQHFPLRDLFRRLHMQFAGQAELAGLSLRFSPGGKWVTSDPHLLERILGNLIQNALKYTVRGGIVVVARSTATRFNLEVWDTGVGIAESELPRIFDEYYQVRGHAALRQQGIGMGLAIVRRLVRLLGHRLTVMSRPGRGTMFRLGIEQRGAPEVQDLTAPADTQPMPAGRARTVLIVDDDQAVREGLGALLEESGYAAVQAASLEETRQILRVLELPPDLLLTDLRLGGGPGGRAVIDEVRRECGFELPVIVITGDTVSDELQQLDGACPVLFKPVDPRALLKRVRDLVS